ncbi:hypothetical protein VQ643_04705 [Pseudomonas sp. F1_0610]|uniref:hypothetical protein n=1 Tax=Pseudomonas sp. F1_0610 TaxID=3114284 RepID=UPI0039C18C5B
MTKDQLRAELERQKERFENIYGGEILTYEDQAKPDRRTWKQKDSLQLKSFKREVEKIELRKQEKLRKEAEAKKIV